MEIKVPGRLFKRKIGFEFDMNAWGLLVENTGVDFDKIGELDPETFFKEMLFAASLSWSDRNGKRAWWSKEDIELILDDQPQRVVKQLAKEFSRSKYFGKTMEEWGRSGDKKKQ